MMKAGKKLKNKTLPKYTKGEEIAHTISHGFGIILGIVATILCLIASIKQKNIYAITATIIYGISLVTLYTMSSVYHGLSPKGRIKPIFQVLDHCAIYLLIAGTYAPLVLCCLREYSNELCWLIWSVVWCMAIMGITFTAVDLHKYKVLSMFCYLVMGWCIVFKIHLLPQLMGMKGFLLLLGGGISYTVGAVLYGLGKKHRYIHFTFHLFVLLGSILHFLCIYLYVI